MSILKLAVWAAMACELTLAAAFAARPIQSRDKADFVVSGKVQAVYMSGTAEHASYIVEMQVDEVAKGDGIKKGDIFRAFCYQNKTTSLEWDTAGHKTIPKAGQRIKVFVTNGRGRHEGVYPDWMDVLDDSNK